MFSIVQQRQPGMTRAVSRLSCGLALASALASGVHLLASSGGPGDGREVMVARQEQRAPQDSDVASASDNTGDDLKANVEQYHHRGIAFAPCAENKALDCGTLTVPVDYRKPNGKTVDLAVIRARATNPATRIGILVGNPGGPGVSGVDFVLGVVHAPIVGRLRKHFDIVSFDPRGVSRSRAVGCRVDPGTFPQDPADDAALAAFFDDYSRRFAKACLEQNGSFVTHVGTMNVARDIDVLRRALGERQISYAAGSYGTVLGAAYASMFPERVRAMMLDGVVKPEFHDYLVESGMETSSSFEIAFQRLDQVCRRDAACSLGQTGVGAAFDEVAARLEATPATSPGGAVLTHGALQVIVATLIDTEAFWPIIVDALATARNGDDSLLFQLLPFSASDEGGAFFPITCNDHGARKPAADYLHIDEAIGNLHQRFFGRFFVASLAAPCMAWPSSDPVVIRNVRGRVDTPILFLANDFDPRTTMSEARRMAHSLGFERSILRYAGGGHTAFFTTTACVQDSVETYLVDLRLPPEGSSCPGQPISFGSSLQRRSNATTTSISRTPGFHGVLPPRLR